MAAIIQSSKISHLFDHIVIELKVACECFRFFAVAGEFADKVRVFNYLIAVADYGVVAALTQGAYSRPLRDEC